MSTDLSGRSDAGADAPHRRDSDRLRDCSHLVGLLADQLEALEEDDAARLRELEGMRARLAAEMQEEAGGDTPLLPWLVARVEDSLRRIEERVEADRRARDRVAQLQDGSLPLVRGIRRRSGGGSYLSPGPERAKLDVRL